MRTRWTTCILLAIFFSISSFLALSAVTGAQPSGVEEDDEDALNDPLPPWVDLRVFILRPRVLQPNRLGTCTETIDDIDYFEVTPWFLSRPMEWSLNRATVPKTVKAGLDGVLQASFDAWYPGFFFPGPDTGAKRARLDKVNAILWKKLGRSTLGATFVWYSRQSGEVIEVDTVFNNRRPWAIFPDGPDCQSSPAAYDLQNIATHEFGHWVGLDDLYDEAHKDLTMYGFSAGGEIKKRSLGAGDISGRNGLAP